ncbi:alkyl hydroperoxide reductase [Ekhidna sp.]|uniref:alkyl hydroperoxide reductase n=1 Tax=Ekhidna sp. TaxID=2608089 RepID=UPI003B50FFBB
MSRILKIAAIYNLLWGAWVVLFPNHFFELVGMEPPTHTMIWQGMGMVIGVYGVGYWWASQDPLVHWPIVAVGFLGKTFGPLGFVITFLQVKSLLDFSIHLSPMILFGGYHFS